MKKILLFLFILLLIAAVAIGVFIATFDLNRYKSTIESQIEQATGYPVEIGELSFSVKHGLSLQVDDFELSNKPTDPPNSLNFKVAHFYLKIELEPLIKKEIRVSECIFESPRIEVTSAFQESLQNEQTARPAQPSGAPVSVPPADGGTKPPVTINEFHVSKAKISNGYLRYEDKKTREPFVFTAKNIDLELKNISLTTPIQFDGSADLEIGSDKHFALNGTFSYPEQSLLFNLMMDQSVKLNGSAAQLFRLPVFQVNLNINELDLASFYTEAQKQGEYFAGKLSTEIDFSASGSSVDPILDSMSAKGGIKITQGALKNRNIVREVLENINQIPGMNVIFQSDLGPEYQELLQSKDTTFDSLDAGFRAAGRQITIDRASLVHSEYSAYLSGNYFIGGVANLNASLDFGTQMSAAMIHKVKELAYLATPQQHIVVPFIIQGAFPGVQVRPNVGNIVGQAVSNLAPQLIDQALTSLLKPKKEGETGGSSNDPNAPTPATT